MRRGVAGRLGFIYMASKLIEISSKSAIYSFAKLPKVKKIYLSAFDPDFWQNDVSMSEKVQDILVYDVCQGWLININSEQELKKIFDCKKWVEETIEDGLGPAYNFTNEEIINPTYYIIPHFYKIVYAD